MLVLCKMFAISESLRSGFYEIQEIRELSNRGRVVKFPASAHFRPLLPRYLRLLHLYRERGRFVSIVCIVAKIFSLSRPIQRNFRSCAVALFSNFSRTQKRYRQILRYDIILRVYSRKMFSSRKLFDGDIIHVK